jgi:type I restriction enzyme S subunit
LGGSNLSWIPKPFPNGWIITKIGDITEVLRGASPRPKGDPKYFGGNIPWIMIADVSKSPGRYISETRDTVTEAGALKSRYLKAGTLILSNSGTVCVPKILAVDGCIHNGFVAQSVVEAATAFATRSNCFLLFGNLQHTSQ